MAVNGKAVGLANGSSKIANMSNFKLFLGYIIVGVFCMLVGLCAGSFAGKVEAAYSNVFVLGQAKRDQAKAQVGHASCDLVFQGSLVYLKSARGHVFGRLVSNWIEAGDDLQSRNFKAARETHLGS